MCIPCSVKGMDSQIETIEARLKSFLALLQTEYGVLDRIVYKNKNQHRRCSYFQYLLKVRSDLRLLHLAHLEEVLVSSFLVISGKRAKQKVQLLESLKRKKSDGGKYNILERLRGAARLLSQMVEPLVKAAMEISTLLARSFFMGFSVTVLALLARLRVLVQQILIDVAVVYNMVSSLSQTEQSIKLSQEGFEVFREYYPRNEEVIFLERAWKTDKFVLVEKTTEPENKSPDEYKGDGVSLGSSVIQYQSIETLLGEEENPSSEGGFANVCPLIENRDEAKNGSDVSEPLCENLPSSKDLITGSSPRPNPSKLRSGSTGKVAFVSLKMPPRPSAADESCLRNKRIKIDNCDEEEPFFSLLVGGNKKDSLI